jgi:hypothetical protein
LAKKERERKERGEKRDSNERGPFSGDLKSQLR